MDVDQHVVDEDVDGVHLDCTAAADGEGVVAQTGKRKGADRVGGTGTVGELGAVLGGRHEVVERGARVGTVGVDDDGMGEEGAEGALLELDVGSSN